MRRVVLPALVLAALLCGPAPARADGDPASDTLLLTNAFYPYRPNLVSEPLKKALNNMLAAAKKQRFDLRVAVIASKSDLGSVPQLFTEPQRYADLLTQEITFNNKPRVLVVLPAGIGGNNLGDNAGVALRNVTPVSDDGDGLTRTAIDAVASLARANGTPVTVPRLTSTPKRDQGGTSPMLTFGLPVLLVAIVALVAALRARKGEGEDDAVEDDESLDGEPRDAEDRV